MDSVEDDAHRAPEPPREMLLPRRMWGAVWMGSLLVAFGVGPSLFFGDSNLLLVLKLTIVPWGAFALAEYFSESSGTPRALDPRVSSRFVKILLGLSSILATLGFAILFISDFGSVSEVVSGYQYSSVYTVARMLASLSPFALVLAIYAHYFGILGRRSVTLIAAVLLGANFAASLNAGYLGGVAIPGITFLLFATMVGFMRWRLVALILVSLWLILPWLFTLRNNIREGIGLGRSSLLSAPFERFRIDNQISLLDVAVPSNMVDVPEVGLYFRTALIPRLLDPERPILDIGQSMNLAVGNLNLNNLSFGHYGTVYWLLGFAGVVSVAAVLGGLFGLGVRNFDRLWAVAVLGAVGAPAVWPEMAFPNYFAGFVQFWLICFAAILGAYLIDETTTRSSEVARQPSIKKSQRRSGGPQGLERNASSASDAW